MLRPDNSRGYHAHRPRLPFDTTKPANQDLSDSFRKTPILLPAYSQESIIFVPNET